MPIRRRITPYEIQAITANRAAAIFAAHGYNGTYLREVAATSGVGLSTILYHFESKKGLYLSTIGHVILDDRNLNGHFLPLADVDGSEPQAAADALRRTIRSFLEACHGPAQSPHAIELYAQIMVGQDDEALGMLLSCFEDVQQLLPAFAKRIQPGWSDRQVGFWMQLFWSQLQYTVMGKRLILHDMQLGEAYPPEYLDEAAWHFALYVCLPLGLPAPRTAP